MLAESGEADSGSAEEQPEEEYPDRGRAAARGKRSLRAFFHLPSNALVIPQKTCAVSAVAVILTA